MVRVTGETTEAIPSATVLLLRDGPEGVEVCLLERHLDSDFAGGAYAFPGGKVDPTDHDLDPTRWACAWAEVAAERLGTADDSEAVALLVAAVRETFEEAGVLLARRADGHPVDAADLATPSFTEARRRLAARGAPWDWRPWLEAEELVLDLGALSPYGWWITPHGVHKRFTTRFLAARAPQAQVEALAHDDVEMTDSRWATASAAVADHEAGRAMIIFPTRTNLVALGRYTTVQEVLDAGWDGTADLRPILPEVSFVDGEPRVRHPDGGPWVAF